jgi:hypothetical protein
MVGVRGVLLVGEAEKKYFDWLMKLQLFNFNLSCVGTSIFKYPLVMSWSGKN